MNLAIVARGPTADRIIGREHDFDLILAVNHAAAKVPADWWVFGDVETWRDVQPIGTPQRFVNRRALKKIGGTESLTWESLNIVGPNRNPCECCYSAVAALHLAKHLGASVITCFGVVDEHPQTGESPRWENERRMWNQTTAGLCIIVERA
jgi:hypothetical protein